MSEQQPPTSHWDFLQNAEGIVLLVSTSTGNVVPLILFANPQAFREFVNSAAKAYKSFIPLQQRQAFDMVDAGWNKPSEEDGKKDDTVAVS